MIPSHSAPLSIGSVLLELCAPDQDASNVHGLDDPLGDTHAAATCFGGEVTLEGERVADVCEAVFPPLPAAPDAAPVEIEERRAQAGGMVSWTSTGEVEGLVDHDAGSGAKGQAEEHVVCVGLASEAVNVLTVWMICCELLVLRGDADLEFILVEEWVDSQDVPGLRFGC